MGRAGWRERRWFQIKLPDGVESGRFDFCTDMADIAHIYRERVVPFRICVDADSEFLFVAKAHLLFKRNIRSRNFSVERLVVVIFDELPANALAGTLKCSLYLSEKWCCGSNNSEWSELEAPLINC
jgi:hypothetical protein